MRHGRTDGQADQIRLLIEAYLLGKAALQRNAREGFATPRKQCRAQTLYTPPKLTYARPLAVGHTPSAALSADGADVKHCKRANPQCNTKCGTVQLAVWGIPVESVGVGMPTEI